MSADTNLVEKIFSDNMNFEETALRVFQFQYTHNKIYRDFANAMGADVNKVNSISSIPYLPIRFFKTHRVTTTEFHPALMFESSGTTETINSRHIIRDPALYEKSFLSCFSEMYGNIKEWCVLGLLPSYLERSNSSLVYMVQRLIEQSGHMQSGFYLYNFNELVNILKKLEKQKQKTLLIGVTFALLDFAEEYKMPLQHTVIMETGGMKGRRADTIRYEVHEKLKASFQQKFIHSEYGMAELLSQAYSKGEGIFQSPRWMRVLLREEDDPLNIKEAGTTDRQRGLINIIDLANLYSCSFIATDDLGVLYRNGSFEVLGRMDHSDLRGCSLLAL